jgi:TM2 domain-containing membrane protein YozV
MSEEEAPAVDPSPSPTSGPGDKIPGAEKKLVAGILGILIGSLAIHKFYLGYTKEAVILLVVSILTCGMAGWVVGLIEGIMYLTKSDEEFVATYITGNKPWF